MGKRFKLEYHHIAEFQIDKAIELYLEETLEGYICAITLAGAGEEILGKLTTIQGRESAYQNLLNSLIDEFEDSDKKRIGEISNFVRNSLKHFKEAFCEYDVDLELHARVMVMRAVANYITLRNLKTEKMTEFLEVFESRTKNFL